MARKINNPWSWNLGPDSVTNAALRENNRLSRGLHYTNRGFHPARLTYDNWHGKISGISVGRKTLMNGIYSASDYDTRSRFNARNNFRGAWRRKFRVKAAQPIHRATTLSAKNDTAAFNRRVARVMARQRARGRAIMAVAGISTRRHASTDSRSG